MQSASNREVCYAARDKHHSCLDKVTSSEDACLSTLKAYEDACPASWRSYFDKQRERQVMLELQAEKSRNRSRGEA